MKKIRFILCFLTLSFAGCNTLQNNLFPTYNNGGYIIKKTNSKTLSKSLIISGKVFDKETKEPLANAQVSIDCHKIITSKIGEYRYSTQNSKENLFLETLFIGYKTVLTNFINTNNTSEIQIDFYLVQDDRPLEDCLGTIQTTKN